MHEVNEKAKAICAMKDSLICQVYPLIEKNVFCETVDGNAVGQVIDMIKDLCEAEEKLYKACYYKTVTENMKRAEENQEEWIKMLGATSLVMALGKEDDSTRMGYDNWRYASGRFAPTGKGHFAGYTPDMKRMDENKDMDWDTSKYGYPRPSMNMKGSYRATGRYGYPMDERKSKAYNDYVDAKKHYHESKDPEAKHDMEEHAKKHLMDVLDTTEDIWDDARPEAKKDFKEHMMKFLKDVPVNS